MFVWQSLGTRHSRRPQGYSQMDNSQHATLDASYARSLANAGTRTHRAAGASDDIVARAVVRAKQGDDDAIRYLYVRFAANVYGYARSIIRDDHEAEDVTQQVFAKLITVIHKYEQRAVPFSGLDPAADPQPGDRPPAPPRIALRGGARRRRARDDTDADRRARARSARPRTCPPSSGGPRPAARHGPLARRDRRPPRQVRGIDSRPAPPWPRRAEGRAAGDGRSA